jgi:hypothetical protein
MELACVASVPAVRALLLYLGIVAYSTGDLTALYFTLLCLTQNSARFFQLLDKGWSKVRAGTV